MSREVNPGAHAGNNLAVTAEQILILAIVGAAFVAGWVARDPKGHPPPGDPEPRDDTRAALDAAVAAYVAAVDAWADGDATDVACAEFEERMVELRRVASPQTAELIGALEGATAVLD